MSFDALELIEPAAGRLLGSVALAPAWPEVVLLLAPPIFAFFSTKPPAEAVLDGLLAVLLELLALSRWRQPVAVTCPAMSVDGRAVGSLLCGLGAGWLLGGVAGWLVGGGAWLVGGVVGWLVGGVDVGGVCAASVPHSAMPLHRVAAHCQ